MYKRILVPIDGSATSNNALREGIKLASEQHSQLRIVHVVDEAVLYSDVEGFMDITALRKALQESSKNLLTKAAETAKKGGVDAETAQLNTAGERIATTITEEAKRWSADLIVMGTHGRSGFDRLLMGSIAEGVARIAPAPVLLIRD
ncbi:universal stress protein [Sulfurirhabdus autotrophica]|uniref:Universal stress protein n=1 Tax=Sulfurirhabdus autotrophica TaxID=1706046 RepID=A0A4R3XWW6_9PROT|nr:universal stress protein [Sulfurirhabdus autotrophica]TCV81269.1 nucleotide-binding universal stress UspA family protein [Sulfurirhabdus autotrophica]